MSLRALAPRISAPIVATPGLAALAPLAVPAAPVPAESEPAPARPAPAVSFGAAARAFADPVAAQWQARLRGGAGLGGFSPPAPAATPVSADVAPTTGKGTAGTTRPLGPVAQANARAALAEAGTLDPSHPFVAERERDRSALACLGVSSESRDRIHVADGSLEHGGQVVRAAAGLTALARGAAVSLSTSPPPRELDARVLSPEQLARRADVGRKMAEARSSDDLVAAGLDGLEQSVLDRRLSIAQLRDELPSPPDGKKTFVNMSWGSSPAGVGHRLAKQMLAAPEGSPLHAEATALLGHPPTQKPGTPPHRVDLERAEIEKVERELIYPKLAKAIEGDEHRARMATARAGLADELAAAREQGVLVFASAGNDHELSSIGRHPSLSASSTAGTAGLITVGAIDAGKPGPKDDRVAGFSAAGPVSLSAPGVGIPVGAPAPGQTAARDVDGTSFASPLAVDVAAAMSAANSSLGVDDLARLLVDPRALRDVRGTTRDGGGRLDPFAAVLLAQNPSLTRTQIAAARRDLARPDADVDAIRARLAR